MFRDLQDPDSFAAPFGTGLATETEHDVVENRTAFQQPIWEPVSAKERTLGGLYTRPLELIPEDQKRDFLVRGVTPFDQIKETDLYKKGSLEDRQKIRAGYAQLTAEAALVQRDFGLQVIKSDPSKSESEKRDLIRNLNFTTKEVLEQVQTWDERRERNPAISGLASMSMTMTDYFGQALEFVSRSTDYIPLTPHGLQNWTRVANETLTGRIFDADGPGLARLFEGRGTDMANVIARWRVNEMQPAFDKYALRNEDQRGATEWVGTVLGSGISSVATGVLGAPVMLGTLFASATMGGFHEERQRQWRLHVEGGGNFDNFNPDEALAWVKGTSRGLAEVSTEWAVGRVIGGSYRWITTYNRAKLGAEAAKKAAAARARGSRFATENVIDDAAARAPGQPPPLPSDKFSPDDIADFLNWSDLESKLPRTMGRKLVEYTRNAFGETVQEALIPSLDLIADYVTGTRGDMEGYERGGFFSEDWWEDTKEGALGGMLMGFVIGGAHIQAMGQRQSQLAKSTSRLRGLLNQAADAIIEGRHVRTAGLVNPDAHPNEIPFTEAQRVEAEALLDHAHFIRSITGGGEFDQTRASRYAATVEVALQRHAAQHRALAESGVLAEQEALQTLAQKVQTLEESSAHYDAAQEKARLAAAKNALDSKTEKVLQEAQAAFDEGAEIDRLIIEKGNPDDIYRSMEEKSVIAENLRQQTPSTQTPNFGIEYDNAGAATGNVTIPSEATLAELELFLKEVPNAFAESSPEVISAIQEKVQARINELAPKVPAQSQPVPQPQPQPDSEATNPPPLPKNEEAAPASAQPITVEQAKEKLPELKNVAKQWAASNIDKSPKSRDPIPESLQNLPANLVIRSKVYASEGDIVIPNPTLEVGPNGQLQFSEVSFPGRSGTIELRHIDEIVGVRQSQSQSENTSASEALLTPEVQSKIEAEARKNNQNPQYPRAVEVAAALGVKPGDPKVNQVLKEWSDAEAARNKDPESAAREAVENPDSPNTDPVIKETAAVEANEAAVNKAASEPLSEAAEETLTETEKAPSTKEKLGRVYGDLVNPDKTVRENEDGSPKISLSEIYQTASLIDQIAEEIVQDPNLTQYEQGVKLYPYEKLRKTLDEYRNQHYPNSESIRIDPADTGDAPTGDAPTGDSGQQVAQPSVSSDGQDGGNKNKPTADSASNQRGVDDGEAPPAIASGEASQTRAAMAMVAQKAGVELESLSPEVQESLREKIGSLINWAYKRFSALTQGGTMDSLELSEFLMGKDVLDGSGNKTDSVANKLADNYQKTGDFFKTTNANGDVVTDRMTVSVGLARVKSLVTKRFRSNRGRVELDRPADETGNPDDVQGQAAQAQAQAEVDKLYSGTEQSVDPTAPSKEEVVQAINTALKSSLDQLVDEIVAGKFADVGLVHHKNTSQVSTSRAVYEAFQEFIAEVLGVSPSDFEFLAEAGAKNQDFARKSQSKLKSQLLNTLEGRSVLATIQSRIQQRVIESELRGSLGAQAPKSETSGAQQRSYVAALLENAEFIRAYTQVKIGEAVQKFQKDGALETIREAFDFALTARQRAKLAQIVGSSTNPAQAAIDTAPTINGTGNPVLDRVALELQNHINSQKGGLLGWLIAEGKNSDPASRAMGLFLQRYLGDHFKSVEVLISPGLEAIGVGGFKFGTAFSPRIALNPFQNFTIPADGKLGAVEFNQLLRQAAHEYLHVIGDEIVAAYLDGNFDLLSEGQIEALKTLDQLRVVAMTSLLGKEAAETFASQEAKSGEAARQADVSAGYVRAFADVFSEGGPVGDKARAAYATTSLGEFMTSLFDNADFRKALAQIDTPAHLLEQMGEPPKTKKTLWESVKSLLVRLYGGLKLHKGSALDTALRQVLEVYHEEGSLPENATVKRETIRQNQFVERQTGGQYKSLGDLFASGKEELYDRLSREFREAEGLSPSATVAANSPHKNKATVVNGFSAAEATLALQQGLLKPSEMDPATRELVSVELGQVSIIDDGDLGIPAGGLEVMDPPAASLAGQNPGVTTSSYLGKIDAQLDRAGKPSEVNSSVFEGGRVRSIAQLLSNKDAGIIEHQNLRLGADGNYEIPPEAAEKIDKAADRIVDLLNRARFEFPKFFRWYQSRLKMALKIFESLDSDVAKKENRSALVIAMAITSDGADVAQQTGAAWESYSHWKNTGSLAGANRKGSTRAEGIEKKLELADRLAQIAGGYAKLTKFLNRKGTVKELREQLVKKFGITSEEAVKYTQGELIDETVPFSFIFGAKLGSFHNNLSGDFSTITMDRWFMRTFGRAMGAQLIPVDPDLLTGYRSRFESALEALAKTNSDLLVRAGISQDLPLEEQGARLGKLYFGEAKNRVNLTPEEDQVRLAANQLVKFGDGFALVEAPLSPSHRRWTRAVMQNALNKFNSQSVKQWTPAEAQALLWYYEKLIHDKFGSQQKDREPDYASSANKLYKQLRGTDFDAPDFRSSSSLEPRRTRRRGAANGSYTVIPRTTRTGAGASYSPVDGGTVGGSQDGGRTEGSGQSSGLRRVAAPAATPAAPAEVARFNELTADLQGRELTQTDIDAWKTANPEAYAELEGMREAVLKRGGFNRSGVRFGFYVDGVPLPPAMYENNFGPGYYVAEGNNPNLSGSDVSVSPRPNKRTLEQLGLSEADVEFRQEKVFVKAQSPLTIDHTGDGLTKDQEKLLDAYAAYESAVNDAYMSLHPLNEKWGSFLNYSEVAKKRGGDLLASSIHSKLSDWNSYNATRALLIRDGKLPFDSIRGIGGRTYDGLMDSELVVQRANQIKSANPLNLDNGRLVSPERWADTTSPDIRATPIAYNSPRARAESMASHKIARDFLRFLESYTAREQKYPTGNPLPKLAGNEAFYVSQYFETVAERVLQDNPDDPRDGIPDKTSLYYDEYMTLKNKVGRERVAAHLQGAARELLQYRGYEYPITYERLFKQPPPPRPEPAATPAATPVNIPPETTWRESLGEEVSQAEAYVKGKPLLKLIRVRDDGDLDTSYIGGTHIFKTPDGDIITATKEDGQWEMQSIYDDRVSTFDEGGINNPDALSRLSEELQEKRNDLVSDALDSLIDLSEQNEPRFAPVWDSGLLGAGQSALAAYRGIDLVDNLSREQQQDPAATPAATPMSAEGEAKFRDAEAFAARLAEMSEGERDNIDVNENYYGYALYEARKLIARLPVNGPKFRKVTHDNSYVLANDWEFVANVNGEPYGVTQYDDPDGFADEKVYAFAPILSRGLPIETVWGKGEEADVVEEMVAHFEANRGNAPSATPAAKMNEARSALSNLQTGKYEIDRIPQTLFDAVRQGGAKTAFTEAARSRGGRPFDPRGLVESAAAVARESHARSTREAGTREPRTPRERVATLKEARVAETEALREWAKSEGVYLDGDAIAREWAESLGVEGAEHIAWFDTDTRTWTKANDLSLHRDWNSYFQRLALHNAIFPDTAYELVGFTDIAPDADGNMPTADGHQGGFQVVVRQPHMEVISGRDVTSAEVDEWAARIGLVPNTTTDEYMTKDGQIFVEDLHEGNALWVQTADGPKLAVIDPVIFLNPDLKLKRFGDAAREGGFTAAATPAAPNPAAVVSQENIPGSKTDVLPRLVDAPAETKREYHERINEALRDPDEGGRDTAALILGITDPTTDATGTSVYVNPAGKAEINPVDIMGGFPSKDAAIAYAVLRGAMTAQNAVAGVEVNPNGDQAALFFKTNQTLDANTIEQVARAFVKAGDTALYLQPSGILVVRLGFDETHTDAVFDQTGDAVKALLNVQPTQTHADTFYHENDFDQPDPAADEYGLQFTKAAQANSLLRQISEDVSGRPVLRSQQRQMADRFRQRVQAVNGDFANRGFGDAGTILSSFLGWSGPVATPAATIAANPQSAIGKSVREIMAKAVPEDPEVSMLAAENTKQAANVLLRLLQNPKAQSAKARGQRTVNFQSPDETTAQKIAQKTNQRWDNLDDLLRARVIHALTREDRSTFDPDKVATAPLVAQTVRQADIVAELEMETGVRGEDGPRGKVPFVVFAKLYNDPDSPTGTRWHFVEVRKEGMLFDTQYSQQGLEPETLLNNRAMSARVVGVGRAPEKTKAPTEGAGLAQGWPSTQMAEGIQGEDARSAFRGSEGLDNTSGENVQGFLTQEQIKQIQFDSAFDEIGVLEAKQNRLAQAGQYDAAAKVGEQIQKLFQLLEQAEAKTQDQPSEPNPVATIITPNPSAAHQQAASILPTLYSAEDRRRSQAFQRARVANALPKEVLKRLEERTYVAWGEATNMAQVKSFIELEHGGDPISAFQAARYHSRLTPEQVPLAQAVALDKVNSLIQEIEQLPASQVANRQVLLEGYKDVAANMAHEIADQGTNAAQILRVFRQIADVFAPENFVSLYRSPIRKAQTKALTGKAGVESMLLELEKARADARKTTMETLQGILDAAFNGKIPVGADPDLVTAAHELAKSIGGIGHGFDKASGFPVRAEIENAAARTAALNAANYVRKRFEEAGKTKQERSFLETLESEIEGMVRPQIKAVLDETFGPENDSTKETPTEEINPAKLWEDLGKLALGETAFDIAITRLASAHPAMAVLLAGAKFDARKSGMLRKAVTTNVVLADEIRKGIGSRAMTAARLAEQMREVNPELSETQAQKLSAAVEAVYNEAVAEAAQKRLDAYVKDYANAKLKDPRSQDARDARSALGQAETLRGLVAMGAFSREAYYNAIAKKFGLPQWNPEVAKQLADEARKLDRLSKGSVQRNEASQRLMQKIYKEHIAAGSGRVKGWYAMEVAGSVWTAGILSGFPTQLINTTATTASVFLESSFQGIGAFMAERAAGRGDAGLDAQILAKSLANGWIMAFGKGAGNTGRKALQEGEVALRQGTTVFKSEIGETLSSLEDFRLPGNLESVLRGDKTVAALLKDPQFKMPTSPKDLLELAKTYPALLRFVGRFMLSADALNVSVGSSTKMQQLVYVAAKEEGLQGPQLEARMHELMNPPAEVVQQALDIAEAEDAGGQFGQSGTRAHTLLKSRRIRQIIEQQTYGPDAIREAMVFAEKASFMNPAYGTAGILMMETFGRLNRWIPALKPLAPFPRTMSNLVNAALNYTPVGALRAQNVSVSRVLGEKFNALEKYSKTIDKGSAEYYALHARATAGTAALTTIAILLAMAVGDREENKEPFFEIFGEGPRDYRKKQQLLQAGWRPFSVKIGRNYLRYTDWPALMLILSAVGTAYDRIVFEEGPAEDLLSKGFAIALSSPAVILDKNMVSGLADLMEILRSRDDKTARDRAKRFLSGVVGGVTAPQGAKFAGRLLDGSPKEATTSKGFLMSLTPVGFLHDKPKLNAIGEPIKIPPHEVAFGRLFARPERHPVFTPLLEVDLVVPVPQRFSVVDTIGRGERPRRLSEEEFYEYSKVYAETVGSMLTPQVAETLANYARSGGREVAEKQLQNIGTFAGKMASHQLLQRNQERGDYTRRAPR